MNYRSRMGFGRVQWPWWHDVLVILAMLAIIYVVQRIF